MGLFHKAAIHGNSIKSNMLSQFKANVQKFQYIYTKTGKLCPIFTNLGQLSYKLTGNDMSITIPVLCAMGKVTQFRVGVWKTLETKSRQQNRKGC